MTRQIVYGASLWLFLASIGMTLAAIIIPEWVSWDAYPDSTQSFHPKINAMRGPARPVHYNYGLHAHCDNDYCSPFPRHEDCQGPNGKFCALWRTTGFLMSVTVILEFAGLICFGIIMLGGKQRRDRGWKVLALIIGLCVACQCTSMGIVAGLHSDDDHFFAGWYLAESWTLCTVSWSVQFVTAVGLIASALFLQEEGGYELIPDRARIE